MGEKYELVLSDTTNIHGHRLYRVRALRDIQAHNLYSHSHSLIVHAGDLGGYVENMSNLSQHGECWLFPGAISCSHAQISGNARIFGPATICGYAKVYGRARVFGKALVTDRACIYGDATIGRINDVNYPESTISIYGNAHIHGDASIVHGVNPDSTIIIRGDIDLGGNAELIGVSLEGHLKIRSSIVRNGTLYMA